MKINKRKPTHWILLFLFFGMAMLGLLLRCIHSRRNPVVILYGHKLNGNLLALHRHLREHPGAGLKPVFLSMDRTYCGELQAQGHEVCWAGGFACAVLLGRASALVSDHGLHSLQPLVPAYQWLGLLFFDIWHGMSTMGYQPSETAARHGYDEIWVTSDLYRRIYTTQFGFDSKKVVVTGHARTDRLIDRTESRDALRTQYQLPLHQKLILFAPTWRQQMRKRSLYPFECSEKEFLGSLGELARNHETCVVVRSHLNSSSTIATGFPDVYPLPAARHPDTEAILQACDILICDWSTIAFDWLLLDRPAIFLDVEPPYPLGDFLGDEFRYGEIVSSHSQLLESLARILENPESYWQRYGARHQAAKEKFYGGMADGKATSRCAQRLCEKTNPSLRHSPTANDWNAGP